MAIELDEIFFNALMADAELVLAVGGRIESTCFEVAPDETDNTKLPNIIITDDGLTNQPTTKDMEWESDEDRVQASVDVAAEDPKQVKQLVRMVRKAIANYMATLDPTKDEIPCLQSVQTTGVAWDWMKPCYHDVIIYQCDVDNHIYDNGNN
jgi:hypothetical protein